MLRSKPSQRSPERKLQVVMSVLCGEASMAEAAARRIQTQNRTAWEALSELHGLYLADDEAGALSARDRFCDLYQTGDLPEFYRIVNTLLAAISRVLAWHTAGRPSNGRIEGTNDLLQVLRRTAHGFTNPTNFAARALLVT